MAKQVGETEAIRVYINPDRAGEYGAMWRVLPPESVKSRFDKQYPVGAWAKSGTELMALIGTITKWKLSEGKQAQSVNK